jgi:hypothetical protein
MPDPTLQEAFAQSRAHLTRAQPEHFHAVAYDPTEWHRESLFVTPPYAMHELAQRALARPPFTNRFVRYELAVMQCDYACPRSGLGDFGWPESSSA